MRKTIIATFSMRNLFVWQRRKPQMWEKFSQKLHLRQGQCSISWRTWIRLRVVLGGLSTTWAPHFHQLWTWPGTNSGTARVHFPLVKQKLLQLADPYFSEEVALILWVHLHLVAQKLKMHWAVTGQPEFGSAWSETPLFDQISPHFQGVFRGIWDPGDLAAA